MTYPSTLEGMSYVPMDPRSVLSLRDAEVRTAEGATLLVVDALDVRAGERIVVTGPSGSGKSLLLSTLAGRWPAGLRFAGRRTTELDRIGFVPQRGLDALHPLVPLARQLRRVTGADRSSVVRVLEAVGLDDPALHRRRPTELSGGQAQRASVALAALTNAPLVLADEPTSALDHESRDQTLRLLDEIVGATQALVVATHDAAVVRALGARHLAVSDGVVTELSPRAEQGSSRI
ncbi:ATP-binding cassette domain-containing protein [Promicromonospora iranensis]|uniref:ABC-type glutathione transport system ATPase component n=1 Tax=Promicromonospora iranensis TaxID=1105144 RepID=A0ABU2CK17_9MICO|nr:ATP-binding cassette domain-containing protein [Promicromonospora iranensis]MDR7381683.1 ABC-type glutathione transport system ATPase component [Promicromonospora iranensis]